MPLSDVGSFGYSLHIIHAAAMIVLSPVLVCAGIALIAFSKSSNLPI